VEIGIYDGVHEIGEIDHEIEICEIDPGTGEICQAFLVIWNVEIFV